MTLAFAHTRSIVGINAYPISVEVHLSLGMPSFTIVGLPETAVKESRDRVRSAIINSQFEFPVRKITVNLAPASLPKMGSGYDLPIALGILAASAQIPSDNLFGHEFIAELALSGELRGVAAIIPAILAIAKDEHHLIIAESNAEEASLTRSPNVFMASNLREVCEYLCNQTALKPLPAPKMPVESTDTIDWSDIKGQAHAKRALEIAANGGHSVLLSGPPGSGKTMLAKRFSTLLPLLSEADALECAAIRAIHGRALNLSNWQEAPYRAPHHTASSVALVGGGNPPKPGEISLAHKGVLFLDEFPEFSRHVLECLREPIESGYVMISRAAMQVEFPARFQLIAAMNPCPCGHFGNPDGNCLCSPDKISRYLAKLSGPLMDRIDMHIQVNTLPREELIKKHEVLPPQSPMLRARAVTLKIKQMERQQCLNAELAPKQIEVVTQLGEAELSFVNHALSKLKLSARAYHRLLKVARTIADMNDEERVTIGALQQAFSYRKILAAPK